jgi:hypothetical protein
MYVSRGRLYPAFDLIGEMGQDAGVRVVAGHDPRVRERFPALGGQDGVLVLSGQEQRTTKRRVDDKPVRPGHVGGRSGSTENKRPTRTLPLL